VAVLPVFELSKITQPCQNPGTFPEISLQHGNSGKPRQFGSVLLVQNYEI
jgi:hypothetical protein